MDSFFQDRVDKISIDFREGDEDKLTILNPGVWDMEFFGVKFNIIEEKDIQINRSRSSEIRWFLMSGEVQGLPDQSRFLTLRSQTNPGGVAHGLRLKEGRSC